jgi:hypothetical protein
MTEESLSIPSRGNSFSLLYKVQTASESHPASYKMGTGGRFLGVKAAQA